MRHIKANSLVIGMISSILGGCGGSTAIDEKVVQSSSHKMQARAAGSVAEATCAPWDTTAVYTKDNCVSYQGSQYKAKWWTQGNVPGADQ